MNAMTGQLVQIGNGVDGLSLDDAHIWRSKLVEKCAEAERHLLGLLSARGKKCPAKAPLSQKIETLKKALDENVKADAKILALLERLRPYSDLRSDLVHSTMSIATIEDEQAAIFRSAKEQCEGAGERRLMRLACFREAYDGASNVANSLKQAAHLGPQAGFPHSRE